MTKNYLVCAAFFMAFVAQAQTFTSSNLPIIIVNTDGGATIPDQPKIGANMKIIYRGAGQRNYMTDQNTAAYLNYDGRIATELRGHSSQNPDKKPYGVETRMADNITNLNKSLLGMPSENDWTLMPNAFDPTFMHNVLAYKCSENVGLQAMRTVYCELVLNGDYRGIYVLTESIKIDKDRIDVTPILPTDNTMPNITGGYITKSDWSDGSPYWSMATYTGDVPSFLHKSPDPLTVTAQQDAYVQGVFNSLQTNANSSSLITGYPNIIDAKSFLDYMLIVELGSCVDGYQYSTYLNKDRGGKLHAGPVWDFDLGFGTEWGSQGGRGAFNVWQFDNGDNTGAKFWKDLYDNPTFHCALNKRWQAMRAVGQPLHITKLHALVDSISTLLTEAAGREQQRWAPSPFAGEVTFLKNWLTQRVNWIDTNLGAGYTNCTQAAVPNLVINEIMYNPHATATNANSDDYEYIELKNGGTTPITLSGMYLRNGAVYQFPANATLAANQIIVLASNAAMFQAKYGFAPYGQYFRNFKNSGESILITDGFGQTIDKVLYSNNVPWANADSTGKSIELKNVALDNNVATNWFTRNANGGSPGQENNFVAPCGNTYPAIVINEVNYNSGGGIDPNDWVELHNPTTAAVSLSGWFLKDASTGTFTFPAVSIPASGYLVLCKDTTKFKTIHPAVTNYIKGLMPFGLSSSGDVLTLQSPTTCEVDNLFYGVTAPWAAAANGTGSSLSLTNATLDNSLATSWAASSNQGGSPGKSNTFSPPVASATASTTQGNVPLIVSFNGNASTDNGSIVRYDWKFGDGTIATGAVPPAKTYSVGGTYAATLKVTDNDGFIDTYQITILAGAPPIAEFTETPQTTTTNNAIAFDGSTSLAFGGHTISSYAWNFGDGTAAGSGVSTTHAYTTAGSYVVTLTITDNLGLTDTHRDIVYITNTGTATLVPRSGNWQYLDNGSNQDATNWKTTLSPAWATGNAELGYGDGDEITTVGYGPDATNKYITTYFRKGFTITNPADYTNLVVNLKRDDGAIVYLNGVEIMRDNMPVAPTTFQSTANTSVGVPDESTFFSFNVPSSALIAGVNIVSVEVHQNNAGSSDLSFDLELSASQITGLCNGTPPNIVINEINYNSSPTADSGDWVEIFNATPVVVSLQNWGFQDGTHTFVLPNISIPVGGYLVLCEDTTKFKAIYPTVTNYVKDVLEFGLGNGGEHLTLRSNTGCIVDSLTYKDSAPWVTAPDGNGYTLALNQPTASINNGLASSWAASSTLRGTPGATNVPQVVRIAAKAILGGGFVAATALMCDNMRVLSYFPRTEPYTAAGLACNGETTTAAVLAVSGNDAIVDWVVLELRNNATATATIIRKAALIQRDGDVVDMDGTSAVLFPTAAPGNYFLAIRHRNHLPAMTTGAVSFDATGVNPIDFSSMLINLYGNNPTKIVSGKRHLWGGDANSDGKIVYSGAGTDVNGVSNAVFTNPANPSFLSNIPFNAYHKADVNLDGKVIYAGSGTDVNTISNSVFTNPANPNFQSNIPIFKQLP